MISVGSSCVFILIKNFSTSDKYLKAGTLKSNSGKTRKRGLKGRLLRRKRSGRCAPLEESVSKEGSRGTVADHCNSTHPPTIPEVL